MAAKDRRSQAGIGVPSRVMAVLSALLGWLLLIVLLGALAVHPVGQLVLAAGLIWLLNWALTSRVIHPEELTYPEPVSATWPPPAPEPEARTLEDHGGFAADDLIWDYVANLRAAGKLSRHIDTPKPPVWNPAEVLRAAGKTEAVASRPVRPESLPSHHPWRRAAAAAGLPWPPDSTW